MNWLSFISGLIVGVLVGVIGTYLTEFVRPVGQEHARRLHSWRRERSVRRLDKEAATKDGEHRRQLVEERVGSRWLFHASPHDSGMEGEVLDLDRKAWKNRVIVEWSNPLGRAPTQDNHTEGRVSMEWDVLVRPQAEQRHWSARVLLKSDDDSDGWVMYERLSAPRYER